MHKSFNFLKGRYEKSVSGFFFEKIVQEKIILINSIKYKDLGKEKRGNASDRRKQ